MAKSKKQNSELKCELFETVNANCDFLLNQKAKKQDSWLNIKGIVTVILSIITFAVCIANYALLFLLNKIYLF